MSERLLGYQSLFDNSTPLLEDLDHFDQEPQLTHYVAGTHSGSDDLDRFADGCDSGSVLTDPQGDPEGRSFGGIHGFASGCDHVLPPKSRTCRSSLPDEDQIFLTLHQGSWFNVPATSRHRGLVNVAFADGHVVGASDEIDRTVWRAIGTGNGHEPAGDFQ